MKSISDKFAIDMSSIYLTHPTFFSRITNDTAKTIHDEYWHAHVDKVCACRTTAPQYELS